MMHRKWALIIGGAFVFMLVVSARSATAEAATKDVSVSFSLHSPITLHEPVAVDLLIENRLPYGVSVELGGIGGHNQFRIVTPDGEEVDIPSNNRQRDDIEVIQPQYLKPNEKYAQRLVLNEWASFDKLGTYQITAMCHIPVIRGKIHYPYWGHKQRYLKALSERTILGLEILPRNEAALKKRCEYIVDKLNKMGDDASKFLPLMEELSSVNDPVVIPYLSVVIQSRLQSFALKTLERIGTDEAYKAMVEIAKSRLDETTAAQARKILSQRLPGIRDPEIRKKVEATIQ